MRSTFIIVAALLVGLFVTDVAEARGPVLGQRRAFRQGVRQGARAAGFERGFNAGFNRSAFRNNVNVNFFGSPFGFFNRSIVVVNTFPSAFFGFQTIQLSNGLLYSQPTNAAFVPGVSVQLGAFGGMSLYP